MTRSSQLVNLTQNIETAQVHKHNMKLAHLSSGVHLLDEETSIEFSILEDCYSHYNMYLKLNYVTEVIVKVIFRPGH